MGLRTQPSSATVMRVRLVKHFGNQSFGDDMVECRAVINKQHSHIRPPLVQM